MCSASIMIFSKIISTTTGRDFFFLINFCFVSYGGRQDDTTKYNGYEPSPLSLRFKNAQNDKKQKTAK